MAKQTSEFFLTRSDKERPISAYAELQEAKFAAEASGYTATRHVVSSTTD
jgi:isocitrate lyase